MRSSITDSSSSSGYSSQEEAEGNKWPSLMPHLSSTDSKIVDSALVLVMLDEMGLQKVFQINFSHAKAHTHNQVK